MSHLSSDTVLIFDVWGDYGCFRRFYTTRSPLTYNFPPRPTLAGLAGAILGIGKDQVAKEFHPGRVEFAIRIMRPVKKVRFGINWVETKGQVLRTGRVTERTQILTEFVKDPCYRIYVRADPDLGERLAKHLRYHTSVYTPCLGLSELLADFCWKGEYRVTPLPPGQYEVSSVLPTDKVCWPDEGEGVTFEAGKLYDAKRMPRIISPQRTVQEWHDVLSETTGKPIKACVKEAWKVNDDIVVFL